MAYTIKDGCIVCNDCMPLCPNGAIKPYEDKKEGYWIDPTLCNRCEDYDEPQCVTVCPVSSPEPLRPKRGRSKSTLLPAAILDIFLNGKSNAFASSMVVWEACNVLTQRQDLPWQSDENDTLAYLRSVRRGKGNIRIRLSEAAEASTPVPADIQTTELAIAHLDIRAACLHLIFAAYAVTLDCPWQDSFVINDQQIEKYLGLDKRKDLTKLEKLTLVKELVCQACRLLVTVDWPRQGHVQAFSQAEHAIWSLCDIQYYFEEDAEGYRHLIGLGFTVQPGIWTQQFLNKQDYRRQTAYYQYSTLPHSLLAEVMSNWQQHEGAMRLLLWLLFKLRLGGDHRITVRTLLKIAYGENRLVEATTVRGAHKRLLKTFEHDLETICTYGLQPIFDPETYPPEIQPLWVRLIDIPDDAEAALNFWADDANRDMSLTDTAPRDKWQRLLNARLLGFDVSEDWQQPNRSPTRKKRKSSRSPTPKSHATQISGGDIKAARQRLKLSQRALAEKLGKSQSWIRDIENGRFSVGSEDLTTVRQTLDLRA